MVVAYQFDLFRVKKYSFQYLTYRKLSDLPADFPLQIFLNWFNIKHPAVIQ